MLFYIQDIPIYFPYKTLYPEQHEYITEVIHSLQTRGPCLIEMPSGTGKTISLLSATVSYVLHFRGIKILYCSRTVAEVEKTLHELKSLYAYIETYQRIQFLGVGLTSRKNLCIAGLETNIEHECNKLLESNKCDFYNKLSGKTAIKSGIYTLEDLKANGKNETFCPYYFTRGILNLCDCIVFTYNYLIDPRVKASVLKELTDDCIVIFDEAHNIDNACIEAMCVNITRKNLDNARKEVKLLEETMECTRKENKRILEREYSKVKKEKMNLHDGFISYALNAENKNKDSQESLGKLNTKEGDGFKHKRNKEDNVNSYKHDIENLNTVDSFFDMNYEFAPGNIRNSIHFMSALKRIFEFFKTKMKTTHLTSESTHAFCDSIKELTMIDKKMLSFMSTRLGVLIRTLQLLDTDMTAIKRICDFVTLASQYNTGFSVIFEPFDSQAPTVFSPVLRLYCLDASIALKSVFSYRNIIITSGTLSPLEIYSKILGFVPVRHKEISIRLERNAIGPIIVTKGNDQMIIKAASDVEDNTEIVNISSSFTLRNDPSVIRNYGLLVVEFSKIVPDGLVVFFPSYIFMEQMISAWCELKIIDDILKHKLIFIETPDLNETEKALENYKTACGNGRGGVLFSVARGKVSEGVDFKNEHGRCVIIMGVPYQFTESVRIKTRMEYLATNFSLKPSEFLIFDAMRQAAQCMGRVLRGKEDYGLMVMADYRFEKKDKLCKLPKWINNCLEQGNTNLSIDMAVCIAKRFFREMAQGCLVNEYCESEYK